MFFNLQKALIILFIKLNIHTTYYRSFENLLQIKYVPLKQYLPSVDSSVVQMWKMWFQFVPQVLKNHRGTYSTEHCGYIQYPLRDLSGITETETRESFEELKTMGERGRRLSQGFSCFYSPCPPVISRLKMSLTLRCGICSPLRPGFHDTFRSPAPASSCCCARFHSPDAAARCPHGCH